MAKLAIISSYNESCGNASYTHVLKNALSEHYDVDVIALDLFLLQKDGSIFRKQADQHIREIADKLRGYDYVNIQFEAGLYGSTIQDIRKRIEWLIDASKNLVFTMHRLDPIQTTLPSLIINSIKRLSPAYFERVQRLRRYEVLYYQIVKMVERASKTKNAWICVHTKRDRRVVQEMYRFANCFDYPLAFLTDDERTAVKAADRKAAFRAKHSFSENSRVVGVFGYISAYKGVETAIAAMDFLPDDYVLAMFGSQHPQTIKDHMEVDPFIGQIIDSIKSLSKKKFDEESAALRKFARLNITPPDAPTTVAQAKETMLKRVRFMGNLSDPDFIEALRNCDAVVLPYLEVGQSMSGVLVLALESNSRMFVSNNYSFFEARKYFGDVYHTFDIGNALELAQKIELSDKDFSVERDRAYQKYNIKGLTQLFVEKFGNSSQRTA